MLLIINVVVWIASEHRTSYYVSLVYSIFMSMIFMKIVLNERLKKENEVQIQQKMIIYIVSLLEILSILFFMYDLSI